MPKEEHPPQMRKGPQTHFGGWVPACQVQLITFLSGWMFCGQIKAIPGSPLPSPQIKFHFFLRVLGALTVQLEGAN